MSSIKAATYYPELELLFPFSLIPFFCNEEDKETSNLTIASFKQSPFKTNLSGSLSLYLSLCDCPISHPNALGQKQVIVLLLFKWILYHSVWHHPSTDCLQPPRHLAFFLKDSAQVQVQNNTNPSLIHYNFDFPTIHRRESLDTWASPLHKYNSTRFTDLNCMGYVVSNTNNCCILYMHKCMFIVLFY